MPSKMKYRSLVPGPIREKVEPALNFAPHLDKMDNSQTEHINDEIKHLRLENAYLKVENAELRAENVSLCMKLAHFETAPRGIKNAVMRLPVELLVLIFERSIPPPFLLDSGLHAGPNSPWCKTLRHKKAIIAVCWSWYNAGIRFLYEDVCIRRFDQLFVLLRTFNSGLRLDFGSMVQSLDISCFVAQTIAPEFDKCLDAIIKRCPRLSSIALNLPLYTPSILLKTPSITKLEIEMKLEYEALIDIVSQVRCTLLSLHVGVSALLNDSQGPNTSSRQVILPILESLMLFIPEARTLEIVERSLVMPALHAITFKYRSAGHEISSPEDWRSSIHSFISNHGQNLLFLNLFFESSVHPKDTSIDRFQFIMKHCQSLERLIIRSDVFSFAQWKTSPMTHPRLKWMHLYNMYDKTKRIQKYFDRGLWEGKLPSLQGVQTIFVLPNTLYGWLEHCNPSSDEHFVVNCFQEELKYRFDSVLLARPDWEWIDDNDSDDSNSDDNESKVDSNSDSDSDNDESSSNWSSENSNRDTDSGYTYSSKDDIDMSDGSASQLGETEGEMDKSCDADMDPTPEILQCLQSILGETGS